MRKSGGPLVDGSEIQKKRVCPVCDEAVSADVKVCPSCSTDLTLFSAEDAGSMDMDPEELKNTILSGENGHMSDLLKAAEDDGTIPPKAQPVEIIYEDSVECPECGKSIPADADKCPNCGVQFEVEEVFECPMCRSLLEITVTKCPSCGAEFEDESQGEAESAPAEEKKPEPPASEPAPEPAPAPEVKPAAPASFVERLKQVKEEPGQAAPPAPKPQRELSFAERMKAMKEGKNPDEPSPPAKEPAPVPQPEQKPSPAQPQAPQPATGTGTSISDRVKSLQQGAQAPPAQPPKPEPDPAASSKGDQYKNLPIYIGEVKKLLIMANELKLDVSTSKSVINKAVTAGKSRDLDTAIKLVKEGKAGIERELKSVYLSKIRTLETALGLERKSGKDISDMETALAEAKKALEAGDFQPASEALKSLEARMMSSSPSTLSEAEMDTVGCAIDNAEFLNLPVAEPKSFYEEARNAAARNDMQTSIQLTKKATDSLNKILPAYIAGEMRKAKVTLREIKMMNVEITEPVHMLKEANDHVLHGDYCTALAHIKSFKEFVRKVEE